MVPPQGGWHFQINNERFEGSSESDVIEKVRRWLQNNGRYEGDAEIERSLWNYYCAREPERCKASATATRQVFVMPPALVIPREVTKELQGPPIWGFLNTLAVQWTPAMRDYFLHTVAMIPAILECPMCRDHFRKSVYDHPADVISSKLHACQWVNAIHNLANAAAGHPQYPYERMVMEWGAPTI